MSDEPVRLPPRILRSAHTTPTAEPRPSGPPRQAAFTIARWNDNEFILFDQPSAESWIIYPPRSAYDFLAVRRRSRGTTIVEHHPWSAVLRPEDHPVDARDGCLEHGLKCRAQSAIEAAAQSGYDPFG
jgi:hypothetical protein